jgi:hypothetical protein
MVEVFKTSVNNPVQAHLVSERIRVMQPGYDVHFDLEDCDKILRVENREGSVEAETIIRLLRECNCTAEVLPGDENGMIN